MTENPAAPAKPRANVRPRDGHILLVDGKWKQRFETSKEAIAAGEKLKVKFPVVQITVCDAVEGTIIAID
jgi:hypothetical protein